MREEKDGLGRARQHKVDIKGHRSGRNAEGLLGACCRGRHKSSLLLARLVRCSPQGRLERFSFHSNRKPLSILCLIALLVRNRVTLFGKRSKWRRGMSLVPLRFPTELRTGCQWRQLPKCFSLRSTVYNYFWEWTRYGVLDRIHHTLLVQSREAEGHEPSPTAAIIGTRAMKATEKGGPTPIRSATTRAKTKGIKRNALVVPSDCCSASR
jgi:transposase